MEPKKLIRSGITEKLKEGEWETITDRDELNQLYAIKVQEELAEIQASEHKDIMEFVDLIQVAFCFAEQNGFSRGEVLASLNQKAVDKGLFGRLALNNLNPNNPSNSLYFRNQNIRSSFIVPSLDERLSFAEDLVEKIDGDMPVSSILATTYWMEAQMINLNKQ